MTCNISDVSKSSSSDSLLPLSRGPLDAAMLTTAGTVTTVAVNNPSSVLSVSGTHLAGQLGREDFSSSPLGSSFKPRAVVEKSSPPCAETSSAELHTMPYAHYVALVAEGTAPHSETVEHISCATMQELQQIMKEFSHVKSLKISGDIGDFHWMSAFPNLTDLTLEGLRFTGASLQSATATVHGQCPKLNKITLKNCRNFNDVGMYWLASMIKYGQVTDITLENIPSVSVQAMRQFAKEMMYYAGTLSISDERLQRWQTGFPVDGDAYYNAEKAFCSVSWDLQRRIMLNRVAAKEGKPNLPGPFSPWANMR